MSSPIYVSGEAAITPPLLLGEEEDGRGDWEVSADGATLLFTEDDEGHARLYDDDLALIVADIAALGSVVNGTFLWAVDENEFGKTVIAENIITEYAGFRAYTDGTAEDGRRIQIIESEG